MVLLMSDSSTSPTNNGNAVNIDGTISIHNILYYSLIELIL